MSRGACADDVTLTRLNEKETVRADAHVDVSGSGQWCRRGTTQPRVKTHDDTLMTSVCFDGPSHTFYKRCKAIALLQSTHKQRALKPKGSADDTT